MKDLFSKERKDVLKELFSEGERKIYSKGDLIQRSGDKPKGVYWIEEGMVKAFSINSRGEEYVHLMYLPEEIFSLAWGAYEIDRRIYYQASTDCTLYCLSTKLFIERARMNSRVSFALFMTAVRQSTVYADRVDNLEYKYASERLIYRLLFLAGRLGRKQNDGTIIISGLIHRDIARSIHMTPESFSRELEKLSRRGLIKHDRHDIVLCNVKALAQEIKGGISPNLWGLNDFDSVK
jgi:CRP/FNR family transcriptional regulator, cyclic AMP receptor protein